MDVTQVVETYNDSTDTNNWSAFNPSLVFDGGTTPVVGYAGAAFDGRYIYFVPCLEAGNANGNVLRYDTTTDWSNSGSWSFYSVATLNPSAKGFFGGAFDGRYLYLTAFSNGSNVFGTVFARYDTKAPFATPASWAFYDSSAKAGGGFGGAIFDGKYMYFPPYGGTTHVVLRYDSSLSFSSAAAWSTFDLTQKPSAGGALGGVFDGQYVYFAPNTNNGGTGSELLRYDPSLNFTDKNSWTGFDLTTVNGGNKDFASAVYDGRYVNLIPSQGGLLTRYDTKGAFTDKAAYQSYDLTNVNANAKGFFGGVFDGRYLQLVPIQNKITVRYDTTGPLNSPSSYVPFDMTKIKNITVGGYIGGAFDGEFIYFVNASGPFAMVRFDAKTPPALPATYKGSFF